MAVQSSWCRTWSQLKNAVEETIRRQVDNYGPFLVNHFPAHKTLKTDQRGTLEPLIVIYHDAAFTQYVLLYNVKSA